MHFGEFRIYTWSLQNWNFKSCDILYNWPRDRKTFEGIIQEVFDHMSIPIFNRKPYPVWDALKSQIKPNFKI